MTVIVVSVISSMNALPGGWRTPDFIQGPLLFFSTDFTIIFIAAENRITDIVQPITIPTSKRCHAVVKSFTVNFSIRLSKKCSCFSWYISSVNSTSLSGTVLLLC